MSGRAITQVTERAVALRRALTERVVVADGAMGTMLQASDATVADFRDHEGCNEVLNVTRPDIVRAVHDAYFDAGADCVTTNTFGANLGNLSEYDIPERIAELSEAGARLAREAADASAAAVGRPRWVLGSIGPGTKLPTLGHVTFRELRDSYYENAAGLLRGGADALIIETCPDLLQAKAAIIGAKRAVAALAPDALVIAQLTIETTGTMLLGSEIGAALTALEPLGIDVIGLNCATGPGEMSEHLRYLAAHARIPISCEPNAGLPELTSDGAYYPLTPGELADAHDRFTAEFGLSLVGGCCGTTPEHIAALVERLGAGQARPAGRPLGRRSPDAEPGVASLYSHVPFRQDTAFLAIGERTNANGSKAFREAMIADKFEDCVAIARGQTRDGAHLLDVCVDYVGRDGVADMREIAGRLATAATLPLVLDSTEPAVIEAGLELIGGRAVVNSVNYEDGDGPDSRIARLMPVIREHGAAVVALTIDERGQARTAPWKIEVAERLIRDLTRNWGMRDRGHHRRLPDVPDRHRPGGDAAGRAGDDRGDRRAEAALPRGADDPRRVQRVVRAEAGRARRAELGVPRRVRPGRPRLGDRAPVEDHAAGAHSRGAARGRPRPGLRPAPAGLRPAGPDARAVRGRGRHVGQGRAGRRAGRAAAVGPAQAADHRRRAQRPRGRPGPGAGGAARPGDRQRRAARRHEDGRRAVRLRPDAAAVRAAVRRGDEGLGRLPGAAYGASRTRAAGARSCSPRSGATCTTSARTWSTSSCPTTATTS